MDKDNIEKDGKSVGRSSNENLNGWEQYSNGLDTKINEIGDNDNFLDEVNLSLAQQISTELEDTVTNTNTGEDKNKKRNFKGVKIFAIAFSSLMILVLLLAFTPAGKKLVFSIAGGYIYGKLETEAKPGDDNLTDGGDDDIVQKPVKINEHIVNILLLGVEEIEGASNTDLMIIATMDTKKNTMKLTSIMRDLYVEIPGYSNNRLNSAYAKGGIDLLYQTIKQNFDVDLDGYVLVNFSAFEKVVDLVGGVDVTLTNKEANYLNTTNYISNPAYRNVHEGTQLMNGNQALGYCRVRKVSTGTENNDFGRTQRQRAVLNSIFEKVKSKNILQLGLLMNDILNNVKPKTDITQSEFSQYLEEAASLNVKDLQQHRIPSDGNYMGQKVQMGKYMQEVLVPTDWEAARKEIHDFIYGADATPQLTVTPEVTPVQ
jgi:LCP family protein required for cell wall assembly